MANLEPNPAVMLDDMPRRVLLVEDDESHAELVRLAFEDVPRVELVMARRLSDARTLLRNEPLPDIVIADLRLPDGEGTELVHGDAEFPVIIMTCQGSESAAVDAMRAGALDYVVKSEGMFTEMPHIVQRARREWLLLRAREQANRSLQAQYEVASALVTSTTMQQSGPTILEVVCRSVGWTAAEYWQLDPDRGQLRREARWSSHEAAEDERSTPPAVSRGEGLPGQIWEDATVVHADGSCDIGPFQSALGVPVETSDGFMGALTLYSDHAKSRDERVHLLLSAISKQLAMFVRNQQAEEQRLRISQQFAEHERLAAIGQTASKLMHELGNPLNAMYLSCQLVDRRLSAANVDSRITETMARVLSENRRLNGLLDDFRLLTRRRRIVRKPVELSQLLDRIVKLHESLLRSSGISVHRQQPPGLPWVDVDEDRMAQVLINLVKNAAEAMAQGGRLPLRIEPTDTEVVIEIEDTGPGIPDGVDVYEPFSSTKPAGTGLGLAIAREIVDAHRGSLDHRAAAERGTIFRVHLPVRASGAAPGDLTH